jgi:hypothetical protein
VSYAFFGKIELFIEQTQLPLTAVDSIGQLGKLDEPFGSAYIALVQLHRMIKIHLALAIIVVQGLGLHMHSHQHVAPHDSPEPAKVHVALAADHTVEQGEGHDLDADISAPGNDAIKKTGTDKDLLGLVPVGSFSQIGFIFARQLLPNEELLLQYQPSPYTRPFLRAPPANHSV